MYFDPRYQRDGKRERKREREREQRKKRGQKPTNLVVKTAGLDR